MEVTDGWYRLNAEIDDPIERAIRNGKIRIGTKIAMTGCRVRFLYVKPEKMLTLWLSRLEPIVKMAERFWRSDSLSGYRYTGTRPTLLHGTPN